ncbi:MAG: FIST N-terminal domain-containing protein [Nannocystaceae bacterium]
MRALSATSTRLDAYEAGRELGEALAAIEPEVVVIFSSIHYDLGEQREGLIDGLGREDVLIFGGTGDGFFETASSSDIGVAALGLSSGGAMRFYAHLERDLGVDSRAAARRCGAAVRAAAGDAPVRLAMVLFDGLATADNRVVEGLGEALDCPVFGGVTSDDRKLETSYVVVDGEAHADAVAVLALCGDFDFVVGVENGTCPVGEVGRVDAAEGNTILRIDGRSALEFVADRLGKSPDAFTHQDIGVVNFQCSARADMRDSLYRSIAQWRRESGALETFGPVEVGQYVRVALVTSDELLAGIDGVLDGVGGAADRAFTPVAALGISCAGRKWFLGPRFAEEIEAVRARFPGLPIIGFPSLGEISPRRRGDGSYSRNLFHNVSFVLTLLGAAAGAPEAT